MKEDGRLDASQSEQLRQHCLLLFVREKRRRRWSRERRGREKH